MDRVPNLKLIVDHLGKPPIRTGQLDEWRSQFKRTSESPQVYAKVSGLNTTTADPLNWSAKDLEPAIDFALECFGADRLMFGSDWPVCLNAGDYQKVVRETEVVLNRYSEVERNAIWGDTAQRLYSING
jgi:L-fuconolactonase